MDINDQIKDLGDKLAHTQATLNDEGSIRANADATLNGKLNALAKVQAEDHDTAISRIDAVATMFAALSSDVAAIKQANDTAGLAREVATIRGVLTKLITALNEEGDDQ
jgi:hypothetical protein